VLEPLGIISHRSEPRYGADSAIVGRALELTRKGGPRRRSAGPGFAFPSRSPRLGSEGRNPAAASCQMEGDAMVVSGTGFAAAAEAAMTA